MTGRSRVVVDDVAVVDAELGLQERDNGERRESQMLVRTREWSLLQFTTIVVITEVEFFVVKAGGGRKCYVAGNRGSAQGLETGAVTEPCILMIGAEAQSVMIDRGRLQAFYLLLRMMS